MYVMHAPRDLDDFRNFSQCRISLNALVYVFSYQLTPPKISKWKKNARSLLVLSRPNVTFSANSVHIFHYESLHIYFIYN